PDAAFRRAYGVDYLWVAPGFELDGKTVELPPWPEVRLVGEDADGRHNRDLRKAEEMNPTMPQEIGAALRRAYRGRVRQGDAPAVRIEGRIADCDAGSRTKKAIFGFGPGAASITIDLRFVEVKTGRVLAGLHHRVVSATSWSTIESKFTDWLDDFTERVA